ncbi:CCR4-NOT transcription complex subunit 6 [Fistulifera solaris]|uniref:CCR4-NOT transcription complex subunit 6 n=1 Tax=Fistulifera solaris TaxID=1519565 RepID=A0A1Z5JQ69_FISSO|nr:CCR4-NOT transcription complex subunit 6 [Fistulifera solaris]|eukprot:GAX16175.1 CCR4-NOT transcription complex subunit 6 [Fistulifera solaris]
MNNRDYKYTWHLSLRTDRPVEGCVMKPHAYMYGKKLDERDMDKPLAPHSKKMREPPPQHEFSYRWFRGPLHEACAYEGCPRRTSFLPHDWSKHALGGTDCTLQCVSTQSSLYKAIFCNSNCFVNAWKTQYTVPKEAVSSRNNTPMRSRSTSAGSMDEDYMNFDDAESTRSSGSKSPTYYAQNEINNNHGTPRGFLGGYTGSNHNPYNNNPAGDFLSGDDWIEISRDQLYVPGPDDVGRKLKLEAAAYSLDTGELLMSRVVKTDVVLARAPDPAKRNLVTAKAMSGGGPRFRVVSYNVLAEIYATQQQYPYCDFWALSWDYRFQNILREILDAAPEVICLQEIQADHYENHVYAAMSDAGFEGVFKQKTRQSMGLAGKVDGCALFWRRSKFHLVESYSIEFNEVAQRQATQVLGLNPRSEEGAAFINRLSKDNIAQLVVLEFIQNTSRPSREINQICIANTHLYSNKDFPDVKLWQIWQLLQELESFIMSRGSNLPLVICGDFNSTPDTAVYDLLSRQSVHPGHPDLNMANSEDIPNVLPDAMNINHSFQLGSAYQTILGDEPWVTNYTVNFKGTLDYIWYSAQNLRPLSAAPVPDEERLTLHGEALPSTEFSSDHIMLISDMQIIGGGTR